MTAPCKGCTKRSYPKCYSECPEYQAFQARKEELNKVKDHYRQISGYAHERSQRSKQKMR